MYFDRQSIEQTRIVCESLLIYIFQPHCRDAILRVFVAKKIMLNCRDAILRVFVSKKIMLIDARYRVTTK